MSRLIIPIEVQALVVNKNIRGRDFRRWRMNFFNLLYQVDPEPKAFEGDIVYDFNRKEHEGVYLHWFLPEAMRIGEQQYDDTTKFPTLPNRWLVVRKSGEKTEKWLIVSDDTDKLNDGGSTFHRGVAGEDGLEITKLGKSIRFDSSGNCEDGFADEKANIKLTAAGFGDINFLAYQPLVNDIFSFHDTLEDLKTEEKENIDYMVVGWYSDPEDDFSRDKLAEELLFAENHHLKKDARSCCYAFLKGVNFNSASSPLDDQKNVYFAVGNSPVDAWGAMISSFLQNKGESVEEAEDQTLFLKAFQHKLDELFTEDLGRLRLKQELRKTWFDHKSTGIKWTSDHKGFWKELEALNNIQKKANALGPKINALKQLLYERWAKLKQKKTPEDEDETYTKLRDNLLSTIEAQKELISKVKEVLPKGTTKVDANVDEDQAPKSWDELILKPVSDKTYFQNADPVVLLSGLKTTHELSFSEPSLSEWIGEVQHTISNKPGEHVRCINELYSAFITEKFNGLKTQEWKQPWNPQYMEWEVEWTPIPFDGNWTFNGEEYELAINPEDIKDAFKPMRLKGRMLLTPENNYILGDRLKELKKKNADLDANHKSDLGWTNLERVIDTLSQIPVLTQRMEGFNDRLILKKTQLSAIPDEHSILRVLGKNDFHQFSGLDEFPNFLDGTRQGQFRFKKISIYDNFGQCQVVVGKKGIKGEDYFLPVKSDSFKTQAGKTISQFNPGRFVQLPPRILQYTHLSMSPSENGLSGWLISNHIDNAISFFNSEGHYLGELIWTPKRAIWDGKKINGTPLGDIKDQLAHSSQRLRDFIDNIDETLSEVDSSLNVDKIYQNMLVGRPLAIMDIDVNLMLEKTYQDFIDLFDDNKSLHGLSISDRQVLKKRMEFLNYDYEVRLGSKGIKADGLIGYFNEAKDKFHPVNHLKEPLDPGFIEPIGKNSFLRLSFNQGFSKTMLFDPTVNIYAQCGILPYATFRIEDEIIENALSNMNVVFRFNSLLTRYRHELEGDQEHRAISMPLPAASEGQWEWVNQYYGESGMVEGREEIKRPKPEISFPKAREIAIKDGLVKYDIKKS